MKEKVEKKHYVLEVLYDNGLKETFPTGEITEVQLNELLSVPYFAFRDNKSAVLRFKGHHDEIVTIDAKKVTRISGFESNEFN